MTNLSAVKIVFSSCKNVCIWFYAFEASLSAEISIYQQYFHSVLTCHLISSKKWEEWRNINDVYKTISLTRSQRSLRESLDEIKKTLIWQAHIKWNDFVFFSVFHVSSKSLRLSQIYAVFVGTSQEHKTKNI